MPTAQIRLLGSPGLIIDGEPSPLPAKAFVLFAILATANRNSVARNQIRAILWGEFDRERANANLRQLIARILKVGQKCGLVLLQSKEDRIRLDLSNCDVDYSSLQAVSKDPERTRDVEDVGGYGKTLIDVWNGPLLEGISFDEVTIDEWMAERRELVQQLYLDACRLVLDARPERINFDTQWRLALRVLDIDRTEEVAYRALMNICCVRGDYSFALRIFKRCEQVLAAALGVRPSQTTQDLAALATHSGGNLVREVQRSDPRRSDSLWTEELRNMTLHTGYDAITLPVSTQPLASSLGISAAQKAERRKIFVSYSRKDGAWLEQFQRMLGPLIQSNRIDLWSDKRLQPGRWKSQIDAAMNETDVALFLVSTNFLASEFIMQHELPALLSAAQERQVTVIWALLDHCLWDSCELKHFQCANDPQQPLFDLSTAAQNKAIKLACQMVRDSLSSF